MGSVQKKCYPGFSVFMINFVGGFGECAEKKFDQSDHDVAQLDHGGTVCAKFVRLWHLDAIFSISIKFGICILMHMEHFAHIQVQLLAICSGLLPLGSMEKTSKVSLTPW